MCIGPRYGGDAEGLATRNGLLLRYRHRLENGSVSPDHSDPLPRGSGRVSVCAHTLVDERGRMLLHRLDRLRRPPVSKVKSKLDGIDSLVRSTGQHPWAHLEAGYWRVQIEDQPVLGYVMRHRAELGDPFTFEIYADARNAHGQRIWVRREESLNSAVAWMMQNADRLVSFAARSRQAEDEQLHEEPESTDSGGSPNKTDDSRILHGGPVESQEQRATDHNGADDQRQERGAEQKKKVAPGHGRQRTGRT
jgi:hypothetical protein